MTETVQDAQPNSTPANRRVFIWTSSNCDKTFAGRFFVNRTIDCLIDAGLGLNDFTYDIKERLVDNPLRGSARLRAIEQCQVAVMFLLWPDATPTNSNAPNDSTTCVSITELTELTVLCSRSMPAIVSRQKADSMTLSSSQPSKLFVVCQRDALVQLPPALDYALTRSGRHSVIRVPWSPGDPGVSMSRFREMAATIASDLLSVGFDKFCSQMPSSSANSRAAWLTVSRPSTNANSLEVRINSQNSNQSDENSAVYYYSDTVNLQTPPQSGKDVESWKTIPIYYWSPKQVQTFLIDVKCPEVFVMQVEELNLDGSELALLNASDMRSHLLVDNMEICRILVKRISQHIPPPMPVSVSGKRDQACRIYLCFDPRDAKLAHQLRRRLIKLNFTVLYHGQLGRSRSEFAMTQMPKLRESQYFVVLLTETATTSPFVFEEVSIIRSLLQVPSSSILALSWNSGASFYPPEMMKSKNSTRSVFVTDDGQSPLPPLLLLLADVQNIPLSIHSDIPLAGDKVGQMVEAFIRPPPPGIVLSTVETNEIDSILAPNAAMCDAVNFQPCLTSKNSQLKSTRKYGCLAANFLLPFDKYVEFADRRLQLLNSIYISPAADIVLFCDWIDAKEAAVPLLNALRRSGLRCFADFESPLSPESSSITVPKSRLRLLLLTASSGTLRPSHPLLSSTQALDTSMSPLLLVLCSTSPTADPDETPPSASYNLKQVDTTFSDSNPDAPSALLLDLSTSRGISRFVTEICTYLGHPKAN